MEKVTQQKMRLVTFSVTFLQKNYPHEVDACQSNGKWKLSFFHMQCSSIVLKFYTSTALGYAKKLKETIDSSNVYSLPHVASAWYI